jgi:hypothetical protein
LNGNGYAKKGSRDIELICMIDPATIIFNQV